MVSVIIAALLIDTSLDKISDLIRPQSDSIWIIVLFVAIGAVYVIGQHLLLRSIDLRHERHKKVGGLPLTIINRVVSIAQYSLAVIVVFVILQVLLMSDYNTVIIFLATSISYLLAISMLGLLTHRFFSWYKSNRNTLVLFYGLASASLMVNAGVTFAFSTIIWPGVPTEVAQHVANLTRLFTDPLQNSLNDMNFVSSILSFILTWGATVLLLRHYSQRLGRVKYWSIVGLPLVYFASQFPTLLLHVFSSLLNSDPAFYGIVLTLIFFLSKTAGAFLFGVAFWTIAKSLRRDSIVRSYMILSAYGLILLFVSNQASVLWIVVPYPPFGLATVSFMGLAAYLILLGIYYSAVSVAEDSTLRQSIRSFAVKGSKLLDSIGTAHMEEEIQKRVIQLTKQTQDRMVEETGIQSSLTEEDMKQYLQEVINEVQKHKPTTNKTNNGNT